MNTQRAEIYRAPHPLGLPHAKGDDYGWFEISRGKYRLYAQASSDEKWEHVSVSKRHECPSWDDMCFVKDLFWGPDECVVQFHPRESEYVNMAKNCLHLWKQVGVAFPEPEKSRVGY